jgi:hypothetical protein
LAENKEYGSAKGHSKEASALVLKGHIEGGGNIPFSLLIKICLHIYMLYVNKYLFINIHVNEHLFI